MHSLTLSITHYVSAPITAVIPAGLGAFPMPHQVYYSCISPYLMHQEADLYNYKELSSHPCAFWSFDQLEAMAEEQREGRGFGGLFPCIPPWITMLFKLKAVHL